MIVGWPVPSLPPQFTKRPRFPRPPHPCIPTKPYRLLSPLPSQPREWSTVPPLSLQPFTHPMPSPSRAHLPLARNRCLRDRHVHRRFLSPRTNCTSACATTRKPCPSKPTDLAQHRRPDVASFHDNASDRPPHNRIRTCLCSPRFRHDRPFPTR